MLTPIEIYNKFQLKVNKNDTNGNVKIPKGKFVEIFNEQKRNWLDEKAKVKESSDYIEDLEFLLETDIPLKKLTSSTLKDDFALPQNFFKRVSGYSLASRGVCKNVVLYNWFIKPKDVSVVLQNSNQHPSFDYQETVALINNSKVSVYKTDFNIDEMYLSYYREPLDIDIEGYIKADGSASTNIQIDLDKKSIEEIINLAALEAVRNTESIEQTNLAQSRVMEQKN